MSPNTFTITPDHLKLLANSYWVWEDCEYGAPAMYCKKPFGNGDVDGDVAAILGWIDVQPQRSRTLVQELVTVLEIACQLGHFTPGTYRNQETYGHDWVLLLGE